MSHFPVHVDIKSTIQRKQFFDVPLTYYSAVAYKSQGKRQRLLLLSVPVSSFNKVPTHLTQDHTAHSRSGDQLLCSC